MLLKSHCFLLILMIFNTAFALEASSEKPVPLKFDSQGRFKIVQFSDLHMREGSPDDPKTLALMGQILDIEKPQLVVLTGDILASAAQPKDVMTLCCQPMAERQIPWAAVLGNHDDEITHDREGLMDIIMSLPYSLSQRGPRDIHGVGNYILPVYSANGLEKQWVLYFLDSNAYPWDKSLGRYDWIRVDQVHWYYETSKKLAAENHGQVYPGLAFFHIPIPEYERVLADDQADVVGHRHENVACPRLNSGLFTAMLERGDIQGTFVGHDHVNDYESQLHGIRLIYGRVTGFTAYGREGFPRGARVILLETNKPNSFTTWQRLEEGVKIQY